MAEGSLCLSVGLYVPISHFLLTCPSVSPSICPLSIPLNVSIDDPPYPSHSVMLSIYFRSKQNACASLGICKQIMLALIMALLSSSALAPPPLPPPPPPHINILPPIFFGRSEVCVLSTDTLHKFPLLYKTNLDPTFLASASL